MKPEWNRPGARERTDVFARGAGAEPDIAILLVAETLQARTAEWFANVELPRCGSDEDGGIGQAVKKSDRGRGGKVRREKAEMKIRLST